MVSGPLADVLNNLATAVESPSAAYSSLETLTTNEHPTFRK